MRPFEIRLDVDRRRDGRVVHPVHDAAAAIAAEDRARVAVQVAGLGVAQLGGARGTFPGLMLRLGHDAQHALERGRLLLGDRRDRGRALVDAADQRLHLLELGTDAAAVVRDVGDRLGRLADAGARALRRRRDRVHRLCDVLRRARRLVGEFADLGGDDGEPAAMRSGAGRLDRGIEREQVRLIGDLADRLRERADPLDVRGEVLDPLLQLGDSFASGLELLERSVHRLDRMRRRRAQPGRDLRGRAAEFGHVHGAGGALRHGDENLIGASRLHRGIVGDSGKELARPSAGRGVVDRRAQAAHVAGQAVEEDREIAGQLAFRVRGIGLELRARAEVDRPAVRQRGDKGANRGKRFGRLGPERQHGNTPDEIKQPFN